MAGVYRRLTIIILITLLALLFVFMLSNTIFFKSLMRINCINADDKNGVVQSEVIWSPNGYEVIIFGDGDMSEYTPRAWSEQLKSMSYGWKIPIRKVTVEEGITSISAGIFSGCNKLNSVWLPHSIEKIGIKSFAYCDALSNIVYQGTVDEWSAVLDRSPLWNDDSHITSVICKDGIFYVSNDSLDNEANN